MKINSRDMATKEKPILFTAPMVRAILDGRKTQTRRVIKIQPAGCDGVKPAYRPSSIPCPYGQPGDRLYVKEASWIWCKKVVDGVTKTGRPKLRFIPRSQDDVVYYCADGEKPPLPLSCADGESWRWKAARFMPRWASRITLEIVDVRIQRVRDITPGDCVAEGIAMGDEGVVGCRHAFEVLWDSINAKRGFGWDVNPWVWCLTFRRVE